MISTSNKWNFLSFSKVFVVNMKNCSIWHFEIFAVVPILVLLLQIIKYRCYLLLLLTRNFNTSLLLTTSTSQVLLLVC